MAGRECKLRAELKQVWLMSGQCGLLVEVTDLMLRKSCRGSAPTDRSGARDLYKFLKWLFWVQLADNRAFSPFSFFLNPKMPRMGAIFRTARPKTIHLEPFRDS